MLLFHLREIILYSKNLQMTLIFEEKQTQLWYKKKINGGKWKLTFFFWMKN